jgi:hypothetical protein
LTTTGFETNAYPSEAKGGASGIQFHAFVSPPALDTVMAVFAFW